MRSRVADAARARNSLVDSRYRDEHSPGGLRLRPEDFRSYVELTDGICDNASGVHFWSLSEIDRVPNILTGEKTRTIDLTLPAHLPDAGNFVRFRGRFHFLLLLRNSPNSCLLYTSDAADNREV